MNRRMLLLTGISLLCAIAACNPRYCADQPYRDCRYSWDASPDGPTIDAPPDGPALCKGDGDCAAPTAVCDISATMLCVQCTAAEPGACSGATPACVSNVCEKCTTHAQCTASNVCLPDGTCADAQQVAYVASAGSGTACTKAAPCGTLDNGVKAGRPFVKMASGTVADSQTTTIDGKSITIFADSGAKLDRTGDGVILEVKNGADVKIFDLEITGATGPTNPAISIPSGGAPKLTLTRVSVDGNQGVGLSSTAGTLTMSQSIVKANTGGGISISGSQFNITNCFIIENGGISSLLGGVDISQIPNSAGIYHLDFNTISANIGQTTIPVNTGINCSTIGMALPFDSNIIYGNIVSGGGQQLGGSPLCTATYSDVGPDSAPGTTNINMPPMFVNPAQDNFHLANSSPAKDAANPAATLLDDVDGDTRPQGPRRDMGADEIKQ